MPTPTLNIVFGGTPEFAVPALTALIAAGHRIAAVYTQPDRPAGRGQHVTQSPVKNVALAHGLNIEQPITLRDSTAAAKLANFQPDVMVVVAYGLILPAEFLAVPRLGCVNIHGSLLPRWRGAAPVHRAVLAGDSLSGVSIMCMNEGLDTGPVLSRHETPIGERETSKSLHDRLALLGAEALTTTLAKYAAGELTPQAQPLAGVTYAHKIRKEEALLDWQRPAVALDAQVRAFNPWPIAETRWHGQQLRVWDAVPLSVDSQAAPGTVMHTDANGILVATGKGVLNLLRVQLAGRKQMSADEFLNAHRIAGDVLEYAPKETPQKEAAQSESK
jgi:methionyl-tRNA formyltransferase